MKRRVKAATWAGILGCSLALASAMTGSAAAQEPCPHLRALSGSSPAPMSSG